MAVRILDEPIAVCRFGDHLTAFTTFAFTEGGLLREWVKGDSTSAPTTVVPTW